MERGESLDFKAAARGRIVTCEGEPAQKEETMIRIGTLAPYSPVTVRESDEWRRDPAVERSPRLEDQWNRIGIAAVAAAVLAMRAGDTIRQERQKRVPSR
jgi:hypothetical protein